MVNRVDRLVLAEIDLHYLQRFGVFNKLMNSYVLRIVFGINCKATLQIFLTNNSAMCFTSNCSLVMLKYLFVLVGKKCRIRVKTCSLCTTVWTFSLLSKIGELGKFYSHILTVHPNLQTDFNPELFPCITIEFEDGYLRVFHTGKVVLLGIKSTEQLTSAVDFLSNLFFDFTLCNDFENF
jgi:hypothetical protein